MGRMEMVKRITKAIPLTVIEAQAALNSALWDLGFQEKERLSDAEYLQAFTLVVKSFHPYLLRQLIEQDRREKIALRQI